MSPEQALKESKLSTKSDIWSFACLILWLLCINENDKYEIYHLKGKIWIFEKITELLSNEELDKKIKGFL